ncbi:hypothetical protein K438DRAFT_192119 [Mycena galopus ATCC 62051]|nr:hypothetical protein K438DRAFT_192119 [Mycena galopus ATCC 62051]
MDRSFLNTSSGALSLLPPSPKIFHGRDSEFEHLISTLLHDGPRAAILGPAGMGKTTLAMAVMHHPEIIQKYGDRRFISCESADTPFALVSIIGLYLGLEPSPMLLKAIIRHFEQCGPCLVVLDNLETPWEPLESRGQVEHVISLLADIPTLAFLITMRGAERPRNVKWNRPFLPPLEPISLSATRQIFSDIADEPDPGEEEAALNDLLDLSGNLPLAVSLMANIASFEGYSGTLARWQIENIALLSDRHDKRSNLEKSISLSLGSPRILSFPPAKDLLGLLSLLPDGIKAEDLKASKVPIPDIPQSRTLLVRTSLAYIDTHGCLKTLSPIREYVRRVHPPSVALSRPLRIYFQDLLELWHSKRQLHSGSLASDLVACLRNMSELMRDGLSNEENAARIAIAYSIITLNTFSAIMLKGESPLMQRVPLIIEATGDAELRWRYASACLRHPGSRWLTTNPDVLIQEGVQYFNTQTHTPGQAVFFYDAAARYYGRLGEIPMATKFNKFASDLAQEGDDIELQFLSLVTECDIASHCGDQHRVLRIAQRARAIGSRSFATTFREHEWTTWEANAYCYMGNLSRALDLCTEAVEQLESVRMETSHKHIELLDILADIHFRKSEYIEARRIHEKIVKATSPTSSPYHGNSLGYIAYLDILMQSEVPKILTDLNAAEVVYATLGYQRILLCRCVAAELALYRGDNKTARAAFIECLSKSQGLYLDLPIFCLSALGDPRHKMQGPWDTFRWAVVYLALGQKNSDPVATLNALRRIADICTADDHETALTLFHAVLETATEMDIHRLKAECMVGVGEIMVRSGHCGQANEMWTAAQSLLVRSSRMTDFAYVQDRLEQLQQQQSDRSPARPTIATQLGILAVADSDKDTMHSSFQRLMALSAPTAHAMESGVSTEDRTELLVL